MLKCENGGICRTGLKDYSFLEKHEIMKSEMAHLFNVTHNGNIQYCVCPSGFTGIGCEVELDTCGEGEHLCFHGSTCTGKADNYSCNCDEAFNGLHHFAGRYCEHKSTSICTPDGESFSGNEAFCANDGKCIKIVDNDEK